MGTLGIGVMGYNFSYANVWGPVVVLYVGRCVSFVSRRVRCHESLQILAAKSRDPLALWDPTPWGRRARARWTPWHTGLKTTHQSQTLSQLPIVRWYRFS